MSSPSSKKLRQLTDMFLSGNATQEQKETLESYYGLFEESPDVMDRLSADQQVQMREEIFQRITLQRSVRRIPIYQKQWFRVAAAILVFIIAAILWKSSYDDRSQHKPLQAALKRSYRAAPYTRNLILPDGSKVILRGESRLNLDGQFNHGKRRELTLDGEAFFDVRHDASQPFIIHTGGIRTTVLGTAFSIKADPKSNTVNVKVLRGKVMVVKGSQLLAVLTPNKQVTANLSSKVPNPVTSSVATASILNWTAEGMNFENMPFEKLSEYLGRRYGVRIFFKNPKLALCRITGTFTGTESLDEILKVLSKTRGTTYLIKDNEVIIDGDGCN